MSLQTTKYKLIKPELTDVADITATNPNWDTVDTQLRKAEDHRDDKTNPHNVTKEQVGLNNVDNTSDAKKPISVATQQALNNKVSKTGDTLIGDLVFENKDDFKAVGKYRTINGKDYYVNYGCGVVGGAGCVVQELHLNGKVLARLELGQLGMAYIDPNGKRTYIHRSGLAVADIE